MTGILSILNAAKLYIGGGLIVAIVILFLLWRGAEAEADREQAAHQTTIANYRQAQAEATAKHERRAREIETRATEETENVTSQYQADLDALRARYRGLLNDTASGSQASGSDLPRVPDAAVDPDDAANLRLPERLIAAEYALQLEALQEWVRRQQAAHE